MRVPTLRAPSSSTMDYSRPCGYWITWSHRPSKASADNSGIFAHRRSTSSARAAPIAPSRLAMPNSRVSAKGRSCSPSQWMEPRHCARSFIRTFAGLALSHIPDTVNPVFGCVAFPRAWLGRDCSDANRPVVDMRGDRNRRDTTKKRGPVKTDPLVILGAPSNQAGRTFSARGPLGPSPSLKETF